MPSQSMTDHMKGKTLCIVCQCRRRESAHIEGIIVDLADHVSICISRRQVCRILDSMCNLTPRAEMQPYWQYACHRSAHLDNITDGAT